MSEIMEEYGGMIIALVGTLLVIAVVASLFRKDDGVISLMFQIWGSGAVK